MEIWVAIDTDKHREVEVRAYKNKDSAIKYAEQIVEDKKTDNEDIEEMGIDEDTPFNKIYSCDGDSIRVERIEIIED